MKSTPWASIDTNRLTNRVGQKVDGGTIQVWLEPEIVSALRRTAARDDVSVIELANRQLAATKGRVLPAKAYGVSVKGGTPQRVYIGVDDMALFEREALKHGVTVHSVVKARLRYFHQNMSLEAVDYGAFVSELKALCLRHGIKL
ncbi:hypothetical protein [Paramagnetospirillum magneticum]|uniref:Uncharacterized protein n=1 Tax=Paramagnetospirillum magneticum (strain ATCC 700264 / AMB-1) TaxID=342108 RepID=Q2W130_PARM1|nr:hypothetical protein [Paramagnetospirillum magneticum]BAE52445.1 hypothetical protein amb3641 [Paramagnetospirillum magneticum AMB-1]